MKISIRGFEGELNGSPGQVASLGLTLFLQGYEVYVDDKYVRVYYGPGYDVLQFVGGTSVDPKQSINPEGW